AHVLEVVVAGAEVEAVVGPRAAGGARVLVLQRRAGQRGRAGVGHVHEAGQPARHRRGRLAGDVGFVLEPRLAEMHLVVDHARQQAPAGGIDHGLARARRQAADGVDAAVADAQVAVELAAFIDQARVEDEGVGHRGEGPWSRGGTGSWPPGWRGWQRPTRRAASELPRSAPWVAMASMAYSEQLGTKRQRGASRGLIQRL